MAEAGSMRSTRRSDVRQPRTEATRTRSDGRHRPPRRQHEGDRPRRQGGGHRRGHAGPDGGGHQADGHRLGDDPADQRAPPGPHGLEHAVERGALDDDEGEEQRDHDGGHDHGHPDDLAEGAALLGDAGHRVDGLVDGERAGGADGGGVDGPASAASASASRAGSSACTTRDWVTSSLTATSGRLSSATARQVDEEAHRLAWPA